MDGKRVTSGITLIDIEDAILEGQEQYIEVFAAVQAEYLAPLMEQMAAMQMANTPPEQLAQIQTQMEGSNYGS